MLLIRVFILAGLVGLHVIGGAVVFRKLFPRESAWWGFFAPMLALLFALDFIEHQGQAAGAEFVLGCCCR